MPIPVSCPSCQRGLQARDEHAGKTLKCPACQTAIMVPAVGAQPPAEPEAALEIMPGPAGPKAKRPGRVAAAAVAALVLLGALYALQPGGGGGGYPAVPLARGIGGLPEGTYQCVDQGAGHGELGDLFNVMGDVVAIPGRDRAVKFKVSGNEVVLAMGNGVERFVPYERKSEITFFFGGKQYSFAAARKAEYVGAMTEARRLSEREDYAGAAAVYERALELPGYVQNTETNRLLWYARTAQQAAEQAAEQAAPQQARLAALARVEEQIQKSDLILDLGGGVPMGFAQIQAGAFTMGSPQDEAGRGNDERPHRVTLSKPFHLGIHPVTQAQYEAVMGTNPRRFANAHSPVETVGWMDAIVFCKKLSKKTGRNVRLPTEAEWEYACRAGTTTAFNTGDALKPDQANYGASRKSQTTPVGSYPANAWGLYDMHGNVWEWCADWYGDYPAGDATNPKGPENGPFSVLRGGSWGSTADNCRSAKRTSSNPDGRNFVIGFRVALD